MEFLDHHPKFSKLAYYELATAIDHEAAFRLYTSAGFKSISFDDPRWPDDTVKRHPCTVMIRPPKEVCNNTPGL